MVIKHDSKENLEKESIDKTEENTLTDKKIVGFKSETEEILEDSKESGKSGYTEEKSEEIKNSSEKTVEQNSEKLQEILKEDGIEQKTADCSKPDGNVSEQLHYLLYVVNSYWNTILRAAATFQDFFHYRSRGSFNEDLHAHIYP